MDNLFGREKLINYFALEGHKKVQGWLSSHSLSFLYYLSQFQIERNIQGNITEIGVFQGRFFVALCLMMRNGEKAAAIDVFEDQHLNIDQSGVGDYDVFVSNLTKILGDCSDIAIIKSDSMKVTSGELLERIGGRIRLFSVDGCHTAEHTESDLHLAAQTVAPGGIVILDDFENTAWPGVRQGAGGFLGKGATLRPFALAYNKLYFTTADYFDEYCSVVKEIAMRSTEQTTYERVSGFDVQKVLLPAVESIFPDAFVQNIDFSSNAAPEKYLVSGWSGPEPWGVWSQTETAELNIPFDAGYQALAMIITFHAFVSERHPEVEITVSIDHTHIGSIHFSYGEDYQNWQHVLSNTDINDQASLHISFEISSPKSPFELGLSADQRKLGIGLRNIRFFKVR